MKAPIAETFHSVQGEGFHTGTPMFFIRLAGCTVGRTGEGWTPPLKSGKKSWVCHTYDNRAFLCDTDFHKYQELDTFDLVAEAKERHICLTGGEPLMHREVVNDLITRCLSERKLLHIETSGTIIPWCYPYWTTVSPKVGVVKEAVQRANEIKLLINGGFDLEKVPDFILRHPMIYLQPLNGETEVNQDNVKLCMKLLETHPEWRLSIQLHKLIGAR